MSALSGSFLENMLRCSEPPRPATSPPLTHGAAIPDCVTTLPATDSIFTGNSGCNSSSSSNSIVITGNSGCGRNNLLPSDSSNLGYGASSSGNLLTGNLVSSNLVSSNLVSSNLVSSNLVSSNFGNTTTNSGPGHNNISISYNVIGNSNRVPGLNATPVVAGDRRPVRSSQGAGATGSRSPRGWGGGGGGPTKQLRYWLVEQIESGAFPGLAWEDAERRTFRVPWKHAAKRDYNRHDDSAIFKAWAVFRGKFREGVDTPEPAAWKMRLRCALGKSTDFEEVVERRRLGVARPYKVYRLMPESRPASARAANGGSARTFTGVFTRISLDLETPEKRPPPPPYPTTVDPLPLAPQAILKQDDPGTPALAGSTCRLMLPALPIPRADEPLELEVSFFVRGLPSGAPLRVRNRLGLRVAHGRPPVHDEAVFGPRALEQLSFPDVQWALACPTQRLEWARLLSHLERGLVLEAGEQGVWARRLCAGRVFWTGPLSRQAQRPNKLDRGASLQVFSTQRFCKELEAYARGEGPAPLYESVFCFGEEYPDPARRKKLLTMHVEPVFARRCCELLESDVSGGGASLQVSSADSLDELASIFKTLQKLC